MVSSLRLLKHLDRVHNDYAQGVRTVFSSFDGGRRSQAFSLAKQQLEIYLEQYSGAHFTHGICAECQQELYEKTPRKGSEVPIVTADAIASLRRPPAGRDEPAVRTSCGAAGRPAGDVR